MIYEFGILLKSINKSTQNQRQMRYITISNNDCVGGCPSFGKMFHWNQLGFLMLLALANKDLVKDQPDKRRRLTHSKQIMKNEPIALNKETSHDGIDRKNLAIFERIATIEEKMALIILFMITKLF